MNVLSTLISAAELMQYQQSGQALQIWDCSGDLMNPPAARTAFEQQHIAGAHYVDLDTDLSDKSISGDQASGGRHPLPSRHKFAAWLGQVGVLPHTQVVVYDRNGCNYCGRAWWMLRWMGHERVAVLDGGLQAWLQAGGNTASGAAPLVADHLKQDYPQSLSKYKLAAIDFVVKASRSGQAAIVDARAAARFRGEVEPIDPVAGHIPGALNRPFSVNLNEAGFFKSPAQLKAEFEVLLGGRDASAVIHHCGSGVSAVPNLLAMEIAGYPPSMLFAGSWSEWSNTPGLPVAKG
jgi:thiosulfate/3-mercaptopyruvate sulfurtransferase